MAAYNGRRAPNVSEYIANLNAIPTAQDLANQGQDNFNLDEELAMFTNTQFFDFDLGQDADLQPTNYGLDGQPRGGNTTAPQNDMKGLGFIQGDFAFPDFNNFAPQPQPFAADGLSQIPQPIQSNHPVYPASSSAGTPISSGLISPQVGEKRKAESISDPRSPTDGFEDASRSAAEEDKRRRNTAASARFRVKKKQREAALERSAKEMSDKVAALEGRINQLETENKWLKNLITEKNENKDDIAVLYKKYSQEASERKGSERKDGVGTAKA